MNTKLFLGFALLLLVQTSEASWEIVFIPNKYVINKNEELRVKYLISGKGDLSVKDVKMVTYSEDDTRMNLVGSKAKPTNIMLSSPSQSATEDTFLRELDVSKDWPTTPYVNAEVHSPFSEIIVKPETSGDKKLIFVLSYKEKDGVWHSKTRELNYHVNNLAEQHEWWITPMVVLAAIVGLWANVVMTILTWKKKKD